MKKIVLLPFFFLFLAGCGGNFSAYPDRAVNSSKELNILKDSPALSNLALDKYYSSADSSRGNLNKKGWRNKVIFSRIRAIDLNYYDYERSLFKAGTATELGGDFAITGLTTLGALYRNSAGTLSTIATGVAGVKGSVDKNIYYNKTMPSMIAIMDANRKRKYSEIVRSSNKDVDQYPLEVAFIDIEDYYYAGTLIGAINEVSHIAGAIAAKADMERK
jgi:hypothetical protein